MQPFTTLTAVAAPLPLANVDTDKILAAQFLKTIHRAGLGKALFQSMRSDPDFVLNRKPWDSAGILIAGDNFGCGSSREHAPWALLDFGFRCVIAPGIADIFYNNCFKNGILPIRLSEDVVDELMSLAQNEATATMTIDLGAQTVQADERTWHFEVDPKRKQDLLGGIDEIGQTLSLSSDIDRYEQDRKKAQPWMPWVDADLFVDEI